MTPPRTTCTTPEDKPFALTEQDKPASMAASPSPLTRPSMSQTPSPAPRDFRQEVTDNIIRLLEEGTAPWQKPWDAANSLLMPMNPTSGKNYRGGNVLQLFVTASKRGYDDPRWMTYRQAQENDWQVRKGEKGTQIEFWDVKRVTSDEPEPGQPDDSSADSDKPSSRLIHKIYTVFNASQIDRIPAYTPKAHTVFEAVAAGEAILTNSGAAIFHDQPDRAYYSRGRDEIHLPPRQAFPDAAKYYGTALHELAHWTGHPKRLDRKTLMESYKFGDQQYAREELQAEIASVFLAAERGIPHDPEHHAAYVANWIKALRDDKNAVFRAASDAAKATDYLLALERGQDVTQEQGETRPAISQVERLQHQRAAERQR